MTNFWLGPSPSLHLDGAGSGLTSSGCGLCDGVWWRRFWCPGWGSHPLLSVELLENNGVRFLRFPHQCNWGFFCPVDVTLCYLVITSLRLPFLILLFWTQWQPFGHQLMIMPPMHNQLLPFGLSQVLTLVTMKPLLYFFTSWQYFSSSHIFLCISAAYPILAFSMDKWTNEYQCSWLRQNFRNLLPPDAASRSCRRNLSQNFRFVDFKNFLTFFISWSGESLIYFDERKRQYLYWQNNSYCSKLFCGRAADTVLMYETYIDRTIHTALNCSVGGQQTPSWCMRHVLTEQFILL